MKIISARFVKGIIGTDPLLSDGKFQVAFLGRSNVGKSTLINSLCGDKKLARSSTTPGKTVRMDFFLINDEFYFVDFPGYGYARRSGDEREKLAKMILWYLLYSGVPHRFVALLLDAKIGLTPLDADILLTIQRQHIDHIVVANKIDNVEKTQRKNCLHKIIDQCHGSPVVLYSSKEGEGTDAVLNRIRVSMEPLPLGA